MKEILVLTASPRANGVCDSLCAEFTAGFQNAGGIAKTVATRDYNFSPCVNCGYCETRPGDCVLHDDAETLLALIRDAPLACLISPIYFYALPAGFKALVDRAQTFWRSPKGPTAAAYVIMAAGRPRGNLLFSGALLTLKYFFGTLDKRVTGTLLFRGLDNVGDISERVKKETFNFGRAVAKPLDAKK